MAATSRVTASGAAVNGNRTTIPESKTTSTNGSATIRTGTNDDGDEYDSPRGDALGSRARIRRHRSKFDRVSIRARQNSLIDCPDCFLAAISSRQDRSLSGLCLDMTEFSPRRKTHSLPDDARRAFAGRLL
jgi:hypothetical protein